jgi:hypothetical protein
MRFPVERIGATTRSRLAFRRATPASDKITAIIAIHKGRIHSGRPAMARTRHKTARKRFAIEKTLTRFQNVIAGEFTTDFIEKLHAIMKERTDNLSTKQLCPEVSPGNTRDLLLDPTTRQPKVERR